MAHLKQVTATIIVLLTLALVGCGDGDKSSDGGDITTVYIWAADARPGVSDGNLFAGDPAAADLFCTVAATGQNFATPVNTHRAMVSFPNRDPRTFFSTSPAAERPDGTPIVADYADFFDSSVTLINSVGTSSNTIVWTGLDSSGGYAGDPNTCRGWTSDSGSDFGRPGHVAFTTIIRFRVSYRNSCDTSLGIYCVSFQK